MAYSLGDGIIHGTTQFWDDAPNWELYGVNHKLGRNCSNCGEPLCDDARGNLCRVCRCRCKSNEIQEQVAALLAYRDFVAVENIAAAIVERALRRAEREIRR
jgi:hypothetical protein